MESEGEYLEQRVERAPGLLREHLGQQLVEESLDAEGLHLRVDQQPAVRLHDARTQGRGCLVLDLDTRKMLFIPVVVKLREREGQRVDLGRSLKGHL